MMIRLSDVDYSGRGMTIQEAFVEEVANAGPLPKPLRAPLSLRWGPRQIVVGDILEVPKKGKLRLEFLGADEAVRQGADVETRPGCVLLDGSFAPLLRTWFDPALPRVVEYDYVADDELLRSCNVYEIKRGRESVAERWTENAGMWIEEIGLLDRIYHCSHGLPDSPLNFEAMVYRLTITS